MERIDPNIALGFRMPQIQDPTAAAARAQEVGVNALKMQEMQRGVESQNKLRELYSQGVDISTPEGFKQVAAIDPATALKLRTDALQGQKLQGDIKKTDVETLGKQMDQFRERTADLISNPSDNNVKAHLEDGILKGLLKPEQAQERWAMVSRMNPEQRKAFFMDQSVKAEKRYEMGTISAAQQQTADLTRRGQDITMRGQDLSRIPVGYRQTDTDAIEPFRGGPTTTTLSPKEIQVREAKRPQATLALKTFEDKTTTLEKDIKELINHPGLPSITGIAAGRLPGITAEGRAAEALFNRIQKAGGFRELQEMRNASPTGGALGQVSNQENTSLQQTFAAIDRTQNAADVKKGLNKALDELTQSKGRVREAFDMTYDYRPADSAAPTGGKKDDPLGIR